MKLRSDKNSTKKNILNPFNSFYSNFLESIKEKECKLKKIRLVKEDDNSSTNLSRFLMSSKGIYYPESPGLPVSQFSISPSLGNHDTDFCTKVEEPISPLQHQHIISISNEEIIPDKKKVLTRTEREIIAERKAIDQRRKIICSLHEQTRIQRINNQRCNHLNKNLFSPQLKIDRKIFSLSPTSVLIRGYNSNINLEKNNEQHILRKNRKKRERNIFSPSSGYKRVYKSMTHEFQPPRTANCCRPKRLFSKNCNNYENSTKDVTLISI